MKKETKKETKRGRDKIIESPEQIWSFFQDYIKHTKSNPIKVKDWVGGMAKPVTREKERPLTNEGFSLDLFEMGIMADVKDYFSNREGRYENFVPICPPHFCCVSLRGSGQSVP